MARTKNTNPPARITVSIPQSLADFIDDIHWTERVETNELYKKILIEWATERGYGSTPKA